MGRISRHLALVVAIGVVALTLFSVNAVAQGIFATLTGVVSDRAQAVVPDAKVTLRDTGSGSTRDTVTNGEGYYTFASVPVGTYALTIEAPGFKAHKEDQISLGGGERRNVNVTLAVGAIGETVEVTGMQDFTVAAVDSGEKSFTLETKELQNFTQVGSNAAEYIMTGAKLRLRKHSGTRKLNGSGACGSFAKFCNQFAITYRELQCTFVSLSAARALEVLALASSGGYAYTADLSFDEAQVSPFKVLALKAWDSVAVQSPHPHVP